MVSAQAIEQLGEVIAAFADDLGSCLANLSHNRIVFHSGPSINSSGVQITGRPRDAKKPDGSHTLDASVTTTLTLIDSSAGALASGRAGSGVRTGYFAEADLLQEGHWAQFTQPSSRRCGFVVPIRLSTYESGTFNTPAQ